MEHIYTVGDYLALFLFLWLGAVLAGGVAAVLLARFLKARYGRVWLCFFPLAGWLLFYFLVSSWAVPMLEWTGCLMIPSQRDTHAAAGEVETVQSVPHTKLYYVNGELREAVIVTIDGSEYYVISEGLLEPGMDVAFTYAPEGSVILSWKQVTRQQAEDIRMENAQMPVPKPGDEPVPVTPEMEFAGTVCHVIGMAGFAICVFLFIQLRHRLPGYVMKRDAQYRGTTVANPMVLALFLVPMLFLFLAVIGDCICSGEYQGLWIFFMALGLMLCFSILSMATQARVEGKTLVIQRWSKEQRYPLEKITSVQWEKRKSMTGRVLVIYFSPHSFLTLSQDDHWGLGDLYDRLDSLMKAEIQDL